MSGSTQQSINAALLNYANMRPGKAACSRIAQAIQQRLKNGDSAEALVPELKWYIENASEKIYLFFIYYRFFSRSRNLAKMHKGKQTMHQNSVMFFWKTRKSSAAIVHFGLCVLNAERPILRMHTFPSLKFVRR